MILPHQNFTIYEIEEIKDLFLSLLTQEDAIIVDLVKVSKIDMSAIQLLLALKKSCDEEHRSFQIINVSDEILNAFEISGTGYILGV